jgi:hypothetical protein
MTPGPVCPAQEGGVLCPLKVSARLARGKEALMGDQMENPHFKDQAMKLFPS